VVDFQDGTAKGAIDAWVREQTAERIQKLFDRTPTGDPGRAVNAV
jgi:serine protease inhibitor